jgi:uncharacterized membrane protein (UPF0127 family)
MPSRAIVLAFWVAAAGGTVVAAPPEAAAQPRPLERFATAPLVVHAASGRQTFTVELALTPSQQAQGLMYRRSLAPTAGMLFLYRPAQPISMWMMNTYVPLDMLFVAADRRIVRIAERTVPLSTDTIPSGQPVMAVIELAAGSTARLGIKVGDRVESPALE